MFQNPQTSKDSTATAASAAHLQLILLDLEMLMEYFSLGRCCLHVQGGTVVIGCQLMHSLSLPGMIVSAFANKVITSKSFLGLVWLGVFTHTARLGVIMRR